MVQLRRVFQQRRAMRWATVVGVAALLPISSTASALPGTAPRGQRAGITWAPCADSALTGLDCGTAEVALDASNPALGTTSINLARRKATGPARQGTLFINPGGPGGNAMGAVKKFATLLGPTVTGRWDIVGVNPRGVDGPGSPRTFTCEVPVAELRDVPHFAWKNEQADALIRLKGVVAASCATAKLAPLAPYMTTADYARDLDYVRQELGEPQLNLYGLSYGTQVGSTYAAMFPATTGRMVLDSAMDAHAWVGLGPQDPRVVPHDERLGSGLGGWETSHQALAECERAGVATCPQAATARADFATVSAYLRAQPLVLETGEPVLYDEFITTWAYGMYRATEFRRLMQFTSDLAKALPKPGQRALLGASAAAQAMRAVRADAEAWLVAERGVLPRGHKSTPSPTTLPQYMTYDAVACTDGINPSDPQLWKKRMHEVDAAAPGFGPTWFWPALTCATWPFKGAHPYMGPFDVKAAHPALILNNQFDPSTPLQGAQRLQAIMPGARLLTVKQGFGHGAIAVSDCARAAAVAYLDAGTFPSADLTCAPDQPLFQVPPPQPTPSATPTLGPEATVPLPIPDPTGHRR